MCLASQHVAVLGNQSQAAQTCERIAIEPERDVAAGHEGLDEVGPTAKIRHQQGAGNGSNLGDCHVGLVLAFEVGILWQVLPEKRVQHSLRQWQQGMSGEGWEELHPSYPSSNVVSVWMLVNSTHPQPATRATLAQVCK